MWYNNFENISSVHFIGHTLKCFVLSFQLPAVAFSVTSLPFSEPMLSVWAQLVNLAGSKLEKHKIKKSLKQGFAGQYMVLPDETVTCLAGIIWTVFIIVQSKLLSLLTSLGLHGLTICWVMVHLGLWQECVMQRIMCAGRHLIFPASQCQCLFWTSFWKKSLCSFAPCYSSSHGSLTQLRIRSFTLALLPPDPAGPICGSALLCG